MRKKELAWIFLVILVANLVLFGFQIIGVLLFWIIILIGALISYKVIPKLKN